MALQKRAGPSRCPFGFSSKYLDTDSGLLYYRHRCYSPDLGRRLCRDPLGEKGGANLYATFQNDPVNAVDPLEMAANKKGATSPDTIVSEMIEKLPIEPARPGDLFFPPRPRCHTAAGEGKGERRCPGE
jgi:RHS repeat-associated protein